MSNHLFPVPTLHVDVIRSIIKRVIVEKRSPLYGNSSKLGNLKELLSVSSTWRQVALEFLWKELVFTVDVTKNKVRLSRPTWLKRKTLPYNAPHLAREICVSVPMSGITSGAAHKLLVDYIRDTKCFPLVNNLIVRIEDSKYLYFDAQDVAIANAFEFAKLLKSVAPAATTVKVMCYNDIDSDLDVDIESDDDSDSDDNSLQTIYDSSIFGWNPEEEILKALANVLYASTNRASLDMFQTEVKNLSTIDYIPSLSWLSLSYSKSSDVHAALVHKSAGTLQYLSIGIGKANMLIFDADGESVMYPDLQHLKLYGCVSNSTDTRATATNTVTFPVLITLELHTAYSFNDDVLFKGNSVTLKYLHLCLNNSTVVMLNRLRTFESKQMSLRHLTITQPSNFRHRYPFAGSEADTHKFLNDLVSAALQLTVHSSEILNACIEAAQRGNGFQHITVITLYTSYITVYDILTLLKVLPALVDLTSRFGDLGAELEDIAADELPDHIASTYGNAGRNLYIWSLNSFSDYQNTAQFVDYILLLALASPRLRRIRIPPSTIHNYHPEIVRALESGPYSKYALQLNRMTDAVRE